MMITGRTIELDGNELARAITVYLLAQGAVIDGPRTVCVSVDAGPLTLARDVSVSVYVYPDGRVIRDDHVVIDREQSTPVPLDATTMLVLDEVAQHSIARTGKTARAIEAGLATLVGGPALAGLHRQVLEEWVSMVSECGGVGDRWVHWRDAVEALLKAIDSSHPTPPEPLVERLMKTLTTPQLTQLASWLTDQQKALLREVQHEASNTVARSSTTPYKNQG